MTANFTGGGAPIAGASVKFTLKKANGNSTQVTRTTDASGNAVWPYTLLAADPNGTYTVTAIATANGKNYTSPAKTFTVAP
jgi:hypothetical protein